MGCKFSIGQKVIAIRDHSEKHFLKDQEFTVFDIECICGEWLIRIFEGTGTTFTVCRHGNTRLLKGYFYSQKSFAPVPEVGEMTFEEVMDMVEPKVVEI
jgi:hypothetical protein